MNYEDILYDENNGVATITINRPDRYNAFRGQTCMELLDAFNRAGWNKDIGVIVFTGAGEKAFCTGGDQGAHEGQYDGRGLIGLPVEELQRTIREVPKPVIARVNGFAIGGGQVLFYIFAVNRLRMQKIDESLEHTKKILAIEAPNLAIEAPEANKESAEEVDDDEDDDASVSERTRSKRARTKEPEAVF